MTAVNEKVVLVTGSSAGIGEATVQEFAKLGYKVVVHGTNKDRIDSVADECEQLSPHGYKPLRVVADLSSEELVRQLMEKTIEKYGRLDVLVNNHGLYRGFNLQDENAYERYRQLMTINMDSVVLLTSLAIPHLLKTKGNIVNVSSTGHQKPLDKGFAYCSAKAALTMFTKSLAIELAPHVRVNSVSPGPVATLMPTRSGMPTETFSKMVGSACLTERVGQPEEIANPIVFLASSQASFITGTDLGVDGGCIIKPSSGTMSSQKKEGGNVINPEPKVV